MAPAPALLRARSLLFVPGDARERLLRAPGRGADAIVVDLEDAVAPARRACAREVVRRALPRLAGPPPLLIRVNAAGSAPHEADIELVGELGLGAIVLPKATPAALERLPDVDVLALIETAEGLRLAHEIASHPAVFALMLGSVDLSAQLGLRARPDGLELLHARSRLVVDSAAAGIRAPFDGVHLRIADRDGLLEQARLARSLGMRGKACIHPAQIPLVHEAFAPPAGEIEWARAVVEAAADGGARELDGAMVDAAVLLAARRILAEAAAP